MFHTTDFINKLASPRTISLEVLLLTIDVTSLYASIPHVDGVETCSNCLIEHRVADASTNVLCSLTSFTLTHNNFVFDGHNYLHTSGTAMGTTMVPNIRMEVVSWRPDHLPTLSLAKTSKHSLFVIHHILAIDEAS